MRIRARIRAIERVGVLEKISEVDSKRERERERERETWQQQKINDDTILVRPTISKFVRLQLFAKMADA